jgi:hypothetical protein
MAQQAAEVQARKELREAKKAEKQLATEARKAEKRLVIRTKSCKPLIP